jgi:hypothetical protein
MEMDVMGVENDVGCLSWWEWALLGRAVDLREGRRKQKGENEGGSVDVRWWVDWEIEGRKEGEIVGRGKGIR